MRNDVEGPDTHTLRTRGPRRRARVWSRGMLVGTLVLAVSACSHTPATEESPVVKENEYTARLLMSTFESGDVSELGKIFYPSAVYDDYSNQREYQGISEIRSYISTLQGWANSIVISVNRVHAWEGGAVVEWTLSAVQDRPIPERVSTATGHEVVVNGVTVLTIENHLITRAADYMDDLTMMLQLGGELHMPGGSVIKNELPSLPDTVGGQG
jgi:hypothetical protein